MYQTLSLPELIKFNKGPRANTKELVIEPCFPGYGTTIGNSLRRVLTSSLSGSAIIAIKIKGVQHEFATIPYVKEDVLDIILNLKRLRFKLHSQSDEPVKVTLSVKGEKAVTGKDITATSDVEIVSKDALIATLTDKGAELEMDLYVKKGMGYSPTEAREKEKLEEGIIAIDAIFTPVVNVNFNVENVRVGQLTNYDRLIMEIETDGMITPEEAVKEASDILLHHFSFISEGKSIKVEEKAPDNISIEKKDEEKAEVSESDEENKKESKEEDSKKE